MWELAIAVINLITTVVLLKSLIKINRVMKNIPDIIAGNEKKEKRKLFINRINKRVKTRKKF